MPPPSSEIPRSLRVVHLRDRLVLHDTTYTLRHGDPSARNSVIDAANLANKQSTSTSTLHNPLTLTPPPGHHHHVKKTSRYLVFEHGRREGYLAGSKEEAGLIEGDVVGVESACGLLGCLELVGGIYVVLVGSVRKDGLLPEGDVYSVEKIRMVRVSGDGGKGDEKLAGAVLKVLESGGLYYALDCDLTRGRQKGVFRGDGSVVRGKGGGFWWTWPLVEGWGCAVGGWSLRTVYGFVGSGGMNVKGLKGFGRGAGEEGRRGVRDGEFMFTLVSRRSRRRAGTRFITRGVDSMGDVANFVETEQIVWRSGTDRVCSFLVNRGSIPVFWRQNNGIARPSPELDAPLRYSQIAFGKHFQHMCRSYCNVVAVSLVDKRGSEGVLADAFERHMELEKSAGRIDGAKLVAFDFHAMCAGKEYERGLAAMLAQLRDDLDRFGIHASGIGLAMDTRQTGIFRVNCVDCLDRTNVMQSLLGRKALDFQIRALFYDAENKDSNVRLYDLSEDRFKHLWGDNADAISKQYSGTGALKTDFTRTGKRSTSGVIGDGVKSVMRMYYKNFIDEGRQEAIDIMCGYATAKVTESNTVTPSLIDVSQSSALAKKPLKSFSAMRMNAGGDRQQVSIDLLESAMSLYSQEGVQFLYPRGNLAAWEKYEPTETKSSKQSARLRMLYQPETRFPGTANPLDLVFREGSRAREQFWRSYSSWASPTALKDSTEPFRIREFHASGVGQHVMADWGLNGSSDNEIREIVVLTVSQTGTNCRPWGLAAVPQDVEKSGYHLLSAKSIDESGPAIAVLVSKTLLNGIVAVNEVEFPSAKGRSKKVQSEDGSVSYPSSSYSGSRNFGPKSISSSMSNGAVAVAVSLADMNLCFVSVNLDATVDASTALRRVLLSLKLGKYPYDILSQHHHVYIAGRMSSFPVNSINLQGGRQWVQLGEGIEVQALEQGVSALRTSFPGLTVKNLLEKNSSSSSHRALLGAKSLQPVCICNDGVRNVRGFADARSSTSSAEKDSCLVVLSELKVNELQTPPAIDKSMGVTSYLFITCRNVLSGEASTKTTIHPTSRPEWHEHVTFSTTGQTARESVTSEYALVAVMIVTPLGDDLAAGYGVVPLRNDGLFDVAVRYGTDEVGRLTGRLQLRWGEGNNDVVETRSSYKNHANGKRSSGKESSGEFARKSTLSDGLSAVKDGLNINANKKKGAKQLKALAGKFSSLFGNSGKTSGRGIPPSPLGTISRENTVSSYGNSLDPGLGTGVFSGSKYQSSDSHGSSSRVAKSQPEKPAVEDDNGFTGFQSADSPRRGPQEDPLMKGLKTQLRNPSSANSIGGDPLLLGLSGGSSSRSAQPSTKLNNFSNEQRRNQTGDGNDDLNKKKKPSSGLLIDI